MEKILEHRKMFLVIRILANNKKRILRIFINLYIFKCYFLIDTFQSIINTFILNAFILRICARHGMSGRCETSKLVIERTNN